jgi:hypothetical protein
MVDLTTDPNYLIPTCHRSDLSNADLNTVISVECGSNLLGWTAAADNNTDIFVDEFDDAFGAVAGHWVAEGMDPTAEDACWEENHQLQTQYIEDYDYNDYGPAYRMG